MGTVWGLHGDCRGTVQAQGKAGGHARGAPDGPNTARDGFIAGTDGPGRAVWRVPRPWTMCVNPFTCALTYPDIHRPSWLRYLRTWMLVERVKPRHHRPRLPPASGVEQPSGPRRPSTDEEAGRRAGHHRALLPPPRAGELCALGDPNARATWRSRRTWRAWNARRTERACMATGIAVRGGGAMRQAAHPQASEQISEHSCHTRLPPHPPWSMLAGDLISCTSPRPSPTRQL